MPFLALLPAFAVGYFGLDYVTDDDTEETPWWAWFLGGLALVAIVAVTIYALVRVGIIDQIGRALQIALAGIGVILETVVVKPFSYLGEVLGVIK